MKFVSCGDELGVQEGIYVERLDYQSRKREHSLEFCMATVFLHLPHFSFFVPQSVLACSSMKTEKVTLTLIFAC